MSKINYKIVMKNKVYDEIFTLMQNIENLNAGKEIAAFLTGDWTFIEKIKEVKLLLDNFIIPTQVVSAAEVEIKEEGMIDVLKQIGIENGNRIKAHWHIHPFSTGDTSWSITDEEKITDFMDPNKNRDIFVFLLSSKDKIKARVIINWHTKHPISGKNYTITKFIDNLEVFREETPDNIYMDILKTKIKEKVTSPVYVPTNYGYNGYGAGYNFKDIPKYLSNYKKQDQFKILCNKKSFEIIIDLEEVFYNYMIECKVTLQELKSPKESEVLRSKKFRLIFDTPNKESMKNTMKLFKNNLYDVQDSFYVE